MSTMQTKLSAFQQETLNHVEHWASKMEPSSLYLAISPGDDHPGTWSDIDSGEFEDFALASADVLRERVQAVGHAHAQWLACTQACLQAMGKQMDELRRLLVSKVGLCTALYTDTSELLDQLAKQMQSLRDQNAIDEALEVQLAPLREVNAAAVILDEHTWRDDAPHSPSHPLVAVLASLDRSAKHLHERPHWANSAIHLAKINAMRGRTLALIAALITKSLDSLAAKAAARLSQSPIPTPPNRSRKSTPSAAGDSREGGDCAASSMDGSVFRQPHDHAEQPCSRRAAREKLEMELLFFRFRELATILCVAHFSICGASACIPALFCRSLDPTTILISLYPVELANSPWFPPRSRDVLSFLT